jgi:hypothetical protein
MNTNNPTNSKKRNINEIYNSKDEIKIIKTNENIKRSYDNAFSSQNILENAIIIKKDDDDDKNKNVYVTVDIDIFKICINNHQNKSKKK